MDERNLWGYLKHTGVLTFDQMDEAIRTQAFLKALGEFTSLGELLIQNEALSRENLAQALQEIRREKDLQNDEKPSPIQEQEENPLAEEIPKELDNFLLEKKIGQGGMGVIYKAVQKDLKRVVALKVLRQDLENSSEQIHRFHREAEAVAKLNNPNIISIYETGSFKNLPYFTMEYIEGNSLGDLLEKGTLDIWEGLEIIESIARALGYAHARGIIHRDIKPSNILLDKNNLPKLTDFGLAKNLDSHSLITHTGEIVGTVSYMSPEQAMGNSRDMDGRSDIYSLGIILYQICCGRLPFQGETTVEILRKIAEEDPITPRRIRQDLHWEIETITLKALEKDPALRYQHAEEMADDVRRFLEGEAIQAKPLTFLNRLVRKVERYKGTVLLILFSFLLTITLLIERHWSQIRLAKIQAETQKNLIQSQQEASAFEAMMFLERSQPQKALKTIGGALKLERTSPRLLYLRGKTRRQLKEYSKAVEDFSRALALNPQFMEVLFLRAETYRDLKDYEKSLVDYTQFIRRGPQFDHALTSRGEVFYLLKKFSEAIEDLDSAIGLNPTYSKNYYLRGKAYLGMEKFKKAQENFELALKYHSKSPDLYLYLARSLFTLGAYEKAREIYLKLLSSSHKTLLWQAHFELAKILMEEENHWEAIERLNQAIELNPQFLQSRLLKARCLINVGEFDRAARQYESLLDTPQGLTLEDKINLSRLWGHLGKVKEALRLLKALPEKQAKTISAQLYLLQNDLTRAEELVDGLISTYPRFAEAYALKGMLFAKKSEFYRAIQNFNFATQLGERHPLIYSLRGNCYLNLNQPEKAKEDFRQADFLSLKAGTPWARFFQMGLEAEKKLLPDRACKMYEYALFLNPGFARAYYRLAYCLSRTWQGAEVGEEVRQKAIFYYRKTLTHNPYSFQGYENLARLYLTIGESERAIQILKKSLALGGKNPQIDFILGLAYWNQKKFSEAKSHFKKIIEKGKGSSLYEIYRYLSLIAKEEGNQPLSDQFKKLYKKNFERDQLLFQNFYQRALDQYKKREYAVAFASAIQILNNYPRSHEAYILRGKARLKMAMEEKISLGNPPSSLQSRRGKLLRQILQIGLDFACGTEIHPENFSLFLKSLYQEQVQLFYHLFSRKEILAYFIKPLDSFPEEGEVYFLKGLFFFYMIEMGVGEREDLLEALTAVDKALKIKPQFAAAWSLRCYLYLLAGDFKKSQFCLDRARSLAPTMAESYYFGACLQAQQGKEAEGISLLLQALDQGFSAQEKILHHPYLRTLKKNPDWRVIRKRISDSR